MTKILAESDANISNSTAIFKAKVLAKAEEARLANLTPIEMEQELKKQKLKKEEEEKISLQNKAKEYAISLARRMLGGA